MKTVFLLSLQFIMNITICSTNDKIIKVSLASKYGLFIVFIIVPNIKSLSLSKTFVWQQTLSVPISRTGYIYTRKDRFGHFNKSKVMNQMVLTLQDNYDYDQ